MNVRRTNSTMNNTATITNANPPIAGSRTSLMNAHIPNAKNPPTH